MSADQYDLQGIFKWTIYLIYRGRLFLYHWSCQGIFLVLLYWHSVTNIAATTVFICMLRLLRIVLQTSICPGFSNIRESNVILSLVFLLSSSAIGGYIFSVHTWSAMFDFIVLHWIITFQCFFELLLRRQLGSGLYSLRQLQEIEYTQLLVIFSSVLGLAL